MTIASLQRLPVAQARALAAQAWRACGGLAEMGHSLIDASLWADAAGRHAVGLAHYIDYLESLLAGRIDGTAVPVIEQPLPAAIRCDARSGIAQWGFDLAFDRLVAATRQCGIALFTQRNCYTAGELAHYPRLLAGRGLIGLACSNSHAMVAPASGAGKAFGTNPLAFGVPRPTPHPPLVMDQAASATAFINIARAAARGASIPDGWAVDERGEATTDPARAVLGALLPFGGSKGANIALMIEVLSAGLAGARWSVDAGHFRSGSVPPDIGLTVIAISPEIADSGMVERLEAHLDRLAAIGVHVPGATGIARLPDELELEAATLATLRAFAARI